MTAYQKIPGPFRRDPATNRLTREWSTPALAALADADWTFTEKVDGTNIRVMWDGYRVTFGGRTDNAQLPVPLYEWLQERFGGPDKEQLLEQKFGASPAVLYGEGYGPKIQAGGRYRADIAVVFYDVLVDNRWWLDRLGVDDVATYFGVESVPVVLSSGRIADAIAMIANGLRSSWGPFKAEGLVGVTQAGLLGRDGQRVIVKIKARDFA